MALDAAAELNVVGLIGLIVFYLLIFCAGILSHKVLKRKKITADNKQVDNETEDMMLAGRDINYFVGIFTMTATWVGGGYINGTAEAVIKNGLVWCQAPFCYAISLTLGGIFFAKKMREQKFVTMLDPLQRKYGANLGALFYIPAFSGEILWSASILAALGTSLRVICGLEDTPSIIISACIAMTYTLFGGLYSVAFTDVFQLICIFVGLIFAIPFMAANDAVTSPLRSSNLTMYQNTTLWGDKSFFGEIKDGSGGLWADYAIMMIFGGIPWQAYFQRVLSSRNYKVARALSFCASFGCFAAAVPSVVIGLITVNTDWVRVIGKELEAADAKLAVPLTLLELTPPAVAFIGLGAVSAAVMSSTDSSILGVSTMFTRNVFINVFYKKASDRVSLWFLRGTVIVNTVIAMLIAIFVKSVYGLYLICSDLVFILLFPHLTLVVWFPKLTNKYGMIAGFGTAFFLRVLAGEPVLKYNAVLKYPYYQEPDVPDAYGTIHEYGFQRFPFRILCMALNMVITLAISFAFRMLFTKVPSLQKYDYLGAVKDYEEAEFKEDFQKGGHKNESTLTSPGL